MDLSGDTALSELDVELVDGRPAVAVVPGTRTVPAAVDWLTGHHDAVRAALHRFGSLLIRGLPITTTDAFAAARTALLGTALHYEERSTPRSELGDGLYSSTDMPARHAIRLHNESSYVLRFPGVLLFGCLVAARENGATTVGDSREVLARLDPGLVARFRERGWTLRRNYHPSLSVPWSQAFGTTDKGDLADYFRDARIAWRWRADGGLVTSQRRAAVLRHPESGQASWFNHVAFWNRHTLDAEMRSVLEASYGADGLPYDTTYGDGEAVPPEEIDHLNEVYAAVERREPYRAGDLLLVDNMLSCHGREPYRGDRKVVVAMGSARSVEECAPDVEAAPGPL